MSSPVQTNEDEVEEVEFVSVSHVYIHLLMNGLYLYRVYSTGYCHSHTHTHTVHLWGNSEVSTGSSTPSATKSIGSTDKISTCLFSV